MSVLVVLIMRKLPPGMRSDLEGEVIGNFFPYRDQSLMPLLRYFAFQSHRPGPFGCESCRDPSMFNALNVEES